jgi:hypothetical protein
MTDFDCAASTSLDVELIPQKMLLRWNILFKTWSVYIGMLDPEFVLDVTQFKN